MLRVKSTVRPKSLWIAAAFINAAIELGLERDILITSGNDSEHMIGSAHYRDDALDLRTKSMQSTLQKKRFVEIVQRRLGPEFQVFLEHLGEAEEHVHAEWDPKRAR